ncbi:MAG TPA: glycoside hydrolase family 3 C-terminal domain-containing protein, partial [Actinomycetota bacterium]|nr:glycoside hydrolase family 3 C-terminal domain-containing protein [Actinomycetota bacterium]
MAVTVRTARAAGPYPYGDGGVSLKLPQSADQLVGAVSAANPNTVVVLASGGPVAMPWLGSAAAVVQTYFGGQEQGSALA